jgi:hypothetical protein
MTKSLAVIATILFLALGLAAEAQHLSPKAMEADINSLLKSFEQMGKKPFETFWPSKQAKEKYSVAKDGTISYTKFFPAGNFATRYQKSVSGAVTYEKWYGNGKDAVLLKKDDRIIDYTAYWPNGVKKAKYQKNRLTKSMSYSANDSKGKQLYP